MESTEIARLRQAAQAHPDDLETRLRLLRALVTAESWAEADEVGTALLQESTPPASTHTLMGIVYGKRARWSEAAQACRQALEAQPDDALLLFNLGTALAHQESLEAAREAFAKAVAQHAAWAEAQYNLGTVLLRLGQHTEAIEAFERALEHREHYPEAHFNRGNAHAMQGLAADGNLDYYEIDCAINAYKRAIQQQPGYTAALYNLGMVYGRMTSSEGVRVWDEYLAASQDFPDEEPWRLRAGEYKRDLQDRLA